MKRNTAISLIESYETEFTRHDGSSVCVIGNYHGWFNELGDRVGRRGVSIDVTQRKRLEEQLNHSMKMEAVGRFAGSIAHDFNNLVTAILGYSDLCLRVLNENDSLYTDISEIKHAATMAAELTRKLLYFSKKQKTKSEKINLNRILGEMDGMLRRLLGEEVEFTTFFDPALCPIKADPGQIEQVIMNLAVNARDAMPNGGKLIIQTELITVADADEKRDIGLLPGRYAVLSIMDTGLGMDAETRSHIFEPFFSTKPKDKGTGLGLSTVYAIMEKNGGIIEVESAKTKGTIFRCYFPSITQKTKNSIRTASGTPVRHATILLVEDKEIVRSMVERVLFGEGYAVVKARNAEQALIMFAGKRLAVDMLITDVNLPEISGYELAEKLKKIYPDLRIIFASGHPEKCEKQKEREARDDIDFIEKPFT
ncbi:MAG: response regulator [Spirochaetia bacterium]